MLDDNSWARYSSLLVQVRHGGSDDQLDEMVDIALANLNARQSAILDGTASDRHTHPIHVAYNKLLDDLAGLEAVATGNVLLLAEQRVIVAEAVGWRPMLHTSHENLDQSITNLNKIRFDPDSFFEYERRYVLFQAHATETEDQVDESQAGQGPPMDESFVLRDLQPALVYLAELPAKPLSSSERHRMLGFEMNLLARTEFYRIHFLNLGAQNLPLRELSGERLMLYRDARKHYEEFRNHLRDFQSQYHDKLGIADAYWVDRAIRTATADLERLDF
jgi:hypothetical protein